MTLRLTQFVFTGTISSERLDAAVGGKGCQRNEFFPSRVGHSGYRGGACHRMGRTGLPTLRKPRVVAARRIAGHHRGRHRTLVRSCAMPALRSLLHQSPAKFGNHRAILSFRLSSPSNATAAAAEAVGPPSILA